MYRRFGRVRAVLSALALVVLLEGGVQGAEVIRGGWSLGMPYQYEETNASGVETLRGLDIEVMRAVSRQANLRPIFEEMPWVASLRGVQEGTLDFAMAASPEASRREWAWFSDPYRRESIAVVFRREGSDHWRSGTPIESIRSLLEGGGSLAVIRGFFYGPEVAALLGDERYRAQIHETDSDSNSMEMMLAGDADAMLADRLAAATVAWEIEALQKVEMLPGALYETDLCFLFSKKKWTEDDVSHFNSELNELRASGALERISRNYLVPQLLLITLETVWFRIFEVIGTVAFAISGVIIARRERYDVIGAIVLAALPAAGGGIMRDLISGRAPLGVMQSPDLLLWVLATVLAGMVFFGIRDRLGKHEKPSSPGKFRWFSTQGLLELSDAIGLATFTIIGVLVAVEQRCEPLWLWGPVMAGLTGAGGGVLRDVLRAQADIPTLKGSIYPEIAILWGFIYSLVILVEGANLNLQDVLLMTLGVMVGIFLTRLLVLQFGLRSLFLGSAGRGT